MVVEASFERFAGFFVMRLLNEDRVTTATAVRRFSNPDPGNKKFNSRLVALN